MTTKPESRRVVAGVDTHKLTHHTAVLDAATGKLLGDGEFRATMRATGNCWAGYSATAPSSWSELKGPAPMAPVCNGTCTTKASGRSR